MTLLPVTEARELVLGSVARTVEVEDPVANKEGSAALFAEVPPDTIRPNQPGAEVFFDNVSVYRNKK